MGNDYAEWLRLEAEDLDHAALAIIKNNVSKAILLAFPAALFGLAGPVCVWAYYVIRTLIKLPEVDQKIARRDALRRKYQR